MSSRNHYLSKLKYADSCAPFVIAGVKVKFIARKKDRDRGSVSTRSHVVYDYRNVYDYIEHATSLKYLLNSKFLQYELQTKYVDAKHVKIDKVTLQELKEIYKANSLLFAKLNNEYNERKLIAEIESI